MAPRGLYSAQDRIERVALGLFNQFFALCVGEL
jgi:hypothetical protein